MKYPYLYLLNIVLLCSGFSFGQQYVNLGVDNDLYFGLDHYYSSGIFISMGKLNPDADQEEAYPKKYLHWTLGQEIYTPKKRYTSDVLKFDYPYGGWLFLERSFEKYKSALSAWGVSLKLGMTGKASLAPYFQNLYHDKVLGMPNVAWEQPLPQMFHVNLNAMQRKRLPLGNRLAFLNEFFGNLGTQRISAGVRLGVLLGSSKALSFLGNPLEMQTKGNGIYLGTRQEYRFHDYMISGGLFNDDAPFVLDSIPYKNSLEVGFAFYNEKWRLLVLWNSISKDNELQFPARHLYLNISIARFF
tara:strand:- start:200 stop:1102 length:903 start_codon:yes stop_codon:yes gene_type:complete